MFTPLFVVHSGYDHSPEGQRHKLARDLRLLHLELREQPEHPFTLFNLGMTYTDAGRYREAVVFLERCLVRSGERSSHVRKAHAYLVCCCQQLRDRRGAWQAWPGWHPSHWTRNCTFAGRCCCTTAACWPRQRRPTRIC